MTRRKQQNTSNSSTSRQTPIKQRHYFFLNPYNHEAFTKCPRCGTKTKVRKLPLVIHIEPEQLFILNKQCRLCEHCDLLIAKQSEIESIMTDGFQERNPDIIGNEYLVIGTLDKSDWRRFRKEETHPRDVIEYMYHFKDVLNFDVIPAGWHMPEKR